MDKPTRLSIAQTIEYFGSDSLKVFGGKFEGGIHLQQVSEEIACFVYDLLLDSNFYWPMMNMLEIGAAAGGNIYVFDHFFNLRNAVIVDDGKHPKFNLRREVLKNIPYKEFTGDSHSVGAVDFVKQLDLKYDIIFIDGDHSYQGVKQDFINFSPYLKPKGKIVFHDTFIVHDVKCFAEELENSPLLQLYGEYIGTGTHRLGIKAFQIKKDYE